MSDHLQAACARDEDRARHEHDRALDLQDAADERAERRAEHAPAAALPARPVAVRAPCTSCPWRTDADAQHIPGLHAALAEGLRGTCEDQYGPLMACHQSREGAEHACAGWLAVYGHRSIRVRASVITGQTPLAALTPQPGWPELHPDFDAMLAGLYATGMTP